MFENALDLLLWAAIAFIGVSVCGIAIMLARTCNVEDRLKTRQQPPYWWPETRSLMQLFLSASIVFMVGFILYQLMKMQVKLEQDQRDLLMILFGIVLGCFKDVYSYTYGSSASARAQGEAINESLVKKDKLLADNATTAAGAATAAASAATDAAVRAAVAVAPLAAAAAAPAAAAAAAPPAADVAAPPAAEAAVDAALNDRGIGVSWWNALTDAERITLNVAAGNDKRVQKFQDEATQGKASLDDLVYLVSQNLLTKERAETLKTLGA